MVPHRWNDPRIAEAGAGSPEGCGSWPEGRAAAYGVLPSLTQASGSLASSNSVRVGPSQTATFGVDARRAARYGAGVGQSTGGGGGPAPRVDGLAGSSTNTISSPLDPIAVPEIHPVVGARALVSE